MDSEHASIFGDLDVCPFVLQFVVFLAQKIYQIRLTPPHNGIVIVKYEDIVECINIKVMETTLAH